MMVGGAEVETTNTSSSLIIIESDEAHSFKILEIKQTLRLFRVGL